MIDRRPWGQPVEVPARDWPSRGRDNPTVQLLNELYLRLERTPRNAIFVPTDSAEEAVRLRRRLIGLSIRYVGRRHISFAASTLRDGTPGLFVRRGPNWGRNGKAEQEVERREQERQR